MTEDELSEHLRRFFWYGSSAKIILCNPVLFRTLPLRAGENVYMSCWGKVEFLQSLTVPDFIMIVVDASNVAITERYSVYKEPKDGSPVAKSEVGSGPGNA